MSDSSADRMDRLERLFEEAMALSAEEREAFLDAACEDDPELRAEVASLLAEGAGAHTFLEDVGRLVEPPGDGPPDRLVKALADRYSIEARVGEGGMATVYRALDLRHERPVALKVLKPELASIVGSGRFLAEIRTTANLQHPAILPLFDSGEADGYLFYVMPYVEGESLRQWLDREHQLPVDAAVSIAVSMAEALDYAHRQGVIHRDVKPGNVLLQDGRPLIADFGIALALSAGRGSRLTQTGLSLGTPHYMSLEQATGDQTVGPATDIYALGCVLYEMLVGEPPFTGATAQAVLSRIITGEVEPVSARRRTVPPNVEAAVGKALEKLPADRFRTGAQFAEALKSPSFGADLLGARGDSPATRRRTVTGYAVAAALGAFVSWSLVARPEPSRRLPVRVTEALPAGQELVDPAQLRLSSDGTMLAYTGPGEDGERWQLWVRRWSAVDGLARPVPNTEGVTQFDLSPGNDEIAIVSEGSLTVRDLESTVARTIAADGVSCCVTWGEDDWLYYTNADRGVSRVPARGGEPEVLTTTDGSYGHEWPAPISGTQLVVFELAGWFSVGSQIALLDMDSGDYRPLSPGGSPIPFGDLILFTTAEAEPELRYLNYGAEQPVATTIAEGLAGDVDHGRPAFDVSTNGDLAYSVQRAIGRSPSTPVWVDRDGAETPVDSTLIGGFRRVRISPDGTRLLLWGSEEGAGGTVRVKELPAGPLIPVTPPGDLVVRPVWAPDGSAIYYVRGRILGDNVVTTINRVRPDGVGEPEEVGLEASDAVMTPDGEWWIARTAWTDDQLPDLFAVPTADVASEPIPLVATDAADAQAAVSRDGRWFAYSSNWSGVSQVYVRLLSNPDSVRVQITVNGGMTPAFSPAADELFVIEAGRLVAYSYTAEPVFRVTGREPLFDVTSYSVGGRTESHNYDVTPDGRTFVMMRRLRAPASSIVLFLDYLSTL